MKISKKEFIDVATHLDKNCYDAHITIIKEDYNMSTLVIYFVNKMGEEVKIKLFDVETSIFPKIIKEERFTK